uniref:Uncharacterized protein n=1 Tax=Ciona savignyi TaxID=51511 RepID=H2Z6B4_CIOSA
MAALTMCSQVRTDTSVQNTSDSTISNVNTLSSRVEQRQRRPRRQDVGIMSYEKLARAFCTCGVLGCAAGAGLVIIFLIGSYTEALGKITNLELISIPGFTLLVLGMVGTIAGIFFCWVTPRPSPRRRQRCTPRDESEAGFEFDRDGGYYNHGMVLDAPPCYSDILRTGSTRMFWAPDISRSFRRSERLRASQRPPSYSDATKPKTDPRTNGDEPIPPPYEETTVTTST